MPIPFAEPILITCDNYFRIILVISFLSRAREEESRFRKDLYRKVANMCFSNLGHDVVFGWRNLTGVVYLCREQLQGLRYQKMLNIIKLPCFSLQCPHAHFEIST